MTTTRSLKTRNRSGAFWGGFLGILAAGLIHTALIPFGVIVGVLCGFYSQEIAAIVRREVTSYVNRVVAFALRVAAIGVATYQVGGSTLQFLKRDALKTGGEMRALGQWFMRIARTAFRWFGIHPMNRAIGVHGLAIVAFVLIQAAVISLGWPALSWYGRTMGYYNNHGNPLIGLSLMLVGLILLCWAVVALMSAIMPWETDQYGDSVSSRMQQFYREYEMYSRSAVGYFLQKLASRLKTQLVLSAWFTLLVAYGVAAGLLWLVALTPIAIFVGIVHGMYRLAKQPDHWPCLITTLIVTFISAGLFHSYFGSPVFLWGTAFGTGVASGLATEAVQGAMNNSTRMNEWLATQMAMPFGDRLRLANRAFMSGVGVINRVPELALNWQA